MAFKLRSPRGLDRLQKPGIPTAALFSPFNVKLYGALGDGATDDSVAIQAAIDEAAINGGIVYFPPGTYIIGTTLTWKSRCHLLGAGVGTTILKLKNSANTAVLTSNNYGTTGIIDASFKDFSIDGNKANNSTGTQGMKLDSDRLFVDNVSIYACKTDGLQIQHSNSSADSTNGATGGFDHFIENVRVANCSGNGFKIDAHDINIISCQAIQCGTRAGGQAGFLVNQLAYLDHCHAWWYDSSGTNNGDYGIKVASTATGSTFIDCIAEGAHLAQAYLDATVIQWIGGSLFPASSDANRPCFEIGSNGASILLDTWMHDYGTGGAIKFTGAGASTVIRGRAYDPGGGAAITGTPDITVDWTRLKLGGGTPLGVSNSIASAGTITVPPNRVTDVTGTTAINFINSANKIGDVITLRFTSTAQVQPGSFIKLSSTSNYNPTAGSTLTLIYVGSSVWAEIGRAIL